MPPSICRRLLMQAFICEVVRALMKLGMAIAAKRPMMATTIMISTNVKPLLRDVLIFILTFYLSFCGVNEATGGLIQLRFSFTHCPLRPHFGLQQVGCQQMEQRLRLVAELRSETKKARVFHPGL